ncbi:MAG: hypothetical protein QM744_18390 [Mesorhizobium sp.]
MTNRDWNSHAGAWIITVAALGGLVVSVVNFFSPNSGITGEPGTLLVIVSTALLALFGWSMTGHGPRSGFFPIFITISALLDIAGTALAAYLLHSWSLLCLMLIAFLGWLTHVFRPRHEAARPIAGFARTER